MAKAPPLVATYPLHITTSTDRGKAHINKLDLDLAYRSWQAYRHTPPYNNPNEFSRDKKLLHSSFFVPPTYLASETFLRSFPPPRSCRTSSTGSRNIALNECPAGINRWIFGVVYDIAVGVA